MTSVVLEARHSNVATDVVHFVLSAHGVAYYNFLLLQRA